MDTMVPNPASSASASTPAGFPLSQTTNREPAESVSLFSRRDDVPGEDWSLFYPCSDGELMADNTDQFDWIVTIVQNLLLLLQDRIAFVAGNLMWYPVQNNNQFFLAPDVMVALTRPQRCRLSYIQSREEGVPPQVVFEIISPSNTKAEMDEKLRLYDLHGVQEYYLYDPDTPRNTEEMERDEKGQRKVRMRLKGYRRHEGRLTEIPVMDGWVSPLLGIRFQFDGVKGLELFHPDGRPFDRFTSLARKLDETKEKLDEREEELGEIKIKLDEREEELGEIKIKLDETKEKLNKTEEKLNEKEEKLNEKEEKLNEKDEKLIEKDEELSGVKADRDAIAKRLEAVLTELEALRGAKPSESAKPV